MERIHLIFSLFFILVGIVLLLLNIRAHKKGKMFTLPWSKSLYGYKESWSIERDNLEDWPLFQHRIIRGYIGSIAIIIGGLIFLWFGIG